MRPETLPVETLFANALTGSQEAIYKLLEFCDDHPISRSEQGILHQRATEALAVHPNDSHALMLLGVLYHEAQQQAVRYDEAIAYYERAIALGHATAMAQRAYMYHKGKGGAVDIEKAKALYDRAIDLGNVDAMANRARMYEKGEGGDVDFKAAQALYDRAIALGHASAMVNRAWMYQKGEGGRVNFGAAIKLYVQVLQQSQDKSEYEESLRQLVGLAKGLIQI